LTKENNKVPISVRAVSFPISKKEGDTVIEEKRTIKLFSYESGVCRIIFYKPANKTSLTERGNPYKSAKTFLSDDKKNILTNIGLTREAAEALYLLLEKEFGLS